MQRGHIWFFCLVWTIFSCLIFWESPSKLLSLYPSMHHLVYKKCFFCQKNVFPGTECQKVITKCCSSPNFTLIWPLKWGIDGTSQKRGVGRLSDSRRKLWISEQPNKVFKVNAHFWTLTEKSCPILKDKDNSLVKPGFYQYLHN